MTGLVKSESLCFDSLIQGRVFFCKHKIDRSCCKIQWNYNKVKKNMQEYAVTVSLKYIQGLCQLWCLSQRSILGVCQVQRALLGVSKIGKTSGLSSREGSFFWQLCTKDSLKAWAHIWKHGDRNIIYRTENQWNPFRLFKLQNKRSGV